MIVIIGGGINGLSIGWFLARAGRQVTVIERGKAGMGKGDAASWAAAGMLAAHVEAEPGEEALLPLLLEGRAAWKDFAGELEAASGFDLGYRSEGTLVVALDRDDRERLKFDYDYHISQGLDLEWLSADQVRDIEGGLSPNVMAGVLSQGDHQVDNRQCVLAARKAFEKAGGILIEETEVQELLVEGSRVRGVIAADGQISAQTVIVAAGAWSRNIAGLPDDTRPPVRPVKGQMLSLKMAIEAPLIDHVIWGPGTYLVPRSDGRLIIGASVEEMGFDVSLTAGGIYELLRRAIDTLPGIYDLAIDDMWAGLRPTSRDDAPILGNVAGVSGLIMATGHHRAGILLAPVTARVIADLVLTGELDAMARNFTPERFAA